jgi:hypothetical protein
MRAEPVQVSPEGVRGVDDGVAKQAPLHPSWRNTTNQDMFYSLELIKNDDSARPAYSAQLQESWSLRAIAVAGVHGLTYPLHPGKKQGKSVELIA